MGYFIETSGRLRLPEEQERQALTVLEVELAGHDGWYDPDQLERDGVHVDSLDDLARFVGSTCLREGEWLLFSTDVQGDPKWSQQATAFYTGLGRFATGGEIHLRGEDGAQWSYRYSPEGVTQVGTNGWDGTPGAGSPAGSPAAPGAQVPPSGPPPGHPEGWDRDNPFFSEPATPPRPAGRTAAMVLLLVVGVMLIVGVALLASGM